MVNEGDKSQDTEAVSLEEVRAKLMSGFTETKPFKPEDRLAAAINNYMQLTTQWLLLQEQLHVTEAVANPETGPRSPDVRTNAEAEIKRIIKAAQPCYYKVEASSARIVALADQCKKPLRADIQEGFPYVLRDKVSPDCFVDRVSTNETSPNGVERPGA